MNINKISANNFTSSIKKTLDNKSNEKIESIKNSLLNKKDGENNES